MAETKQTIQRTTIQDAVRNAAGRFAVTSKTLTEGLACSRTAWEHVRDAEWNLTAARAALTEVDSNMGADLGLGGAKKLLAGRMRELDYEIAALKAVQARLEECRDVTGYVSGNISAYTRASMGSGAVFWTALRNHGGKPLDFAGGIELDEVKAAPVLPEIKLPSIALREHGTGSVEAEFGIDLEPLDTAVKLLEASTKYATAAGKDIDAALGSIADMQDEYATVRESIEGKKSELLAKAKDQLVQLYKQTDGDADLLETLGYGVRETVRGVLEALDETVKTTLGIAINPRTMAEYLPKPEEAKAPEQEEKGKAPAGQEHGEGHDVGQGIALEHCRGEIEKGNADVAVVYFATYGDAQADEVFACLDALARSGKKEAVSVVEPLALIAKTGKPEAVVRAAREKLHELSQDAAVAEEVSSAATIAFIGLDS